MYDAIFQVGNFETGISSSHQCHLSILAAFSPVLRSALRNLQHDEDIVVISEVGSEDLLSLLYQGEVVCDTWNQTSQLLDTLHLLGVDIDKISLSRLNEEYRPIRQILLGSRFYHQDLSSTSLLTTSGLEISEPSTVVRVENIHRSDLSISQQDLPVIETNRNIPGSEISVKCGHCGDLFSSNINLMTHIADNHLLITCKHCGIEVQGNNVLVNHLVQAHPLHQYSEGPEVSLTVPNCPICRQTFVTNQSLKYHLYKHTGVKPYKCDVCNMNFRTPSTLKSHIEVQHTDTKHKCHVCGLKSSTSGKLKIHMRTHTNEKPFQCSYCPNSFKQMSVLKVHEFTHTKKSCYKCDRCDQYFPTKCRLVTHRSKPVCVTRSVQSVVDDDHYETGLADSLGNLESGEMPVLVDSIPVIIQTDIHDGERKMTDDLTRHQDIMFNL